MRRRERVEYKQREALSRPCRQVSPEQQETINNGAESGTSQYRERKRKEKEETIFSVKSHFHFTCIKESLLFGYLFCILLLTLFFFVSITASESLPLGPE
jgi:hypothetical protein